MAPFLLLPTILIPVGYNPYRQKVVRRGDFAILVVTAIAVAALLAWVIFG